MSGLKRRICSLLLLLLVPTLAPLGKLKNETPFIETKASLTSSLIGVAAIEKPSGSSYGTSFILWTPPCAFPSIINFSNSFIKTPFPPILSNVTSSLLSPKVSVRTFSHFILCSSSTKSIT